MDSPPLRLGEAKQQARSFLREGEYPRALALTDQLLAAFPLDDHLRFQVAEILAKAGLSDEAEQLWKALAHHWIEIGQPLRAVVTAHALSRLGRPQPQILAAVASAYADGSPRLARFAARPAPPDLDAPVPDAGAASTLPFDELASRSHRRALDLSPHGLYQGQLHRIPLLSELAEEPLRAVLGSTHVHRLDPGEVIVRQGEPGSSLYLVASGELRVFVESATGGPPRELARVHENSLIGEMALLGRQPRVASVAVVREAHVLEITRAALDAVAGDMPSLRTSLDRFTRERLIKNLLTTSPLFTPFTKDQQAELLRRFEGVEVEAGVHIIREGDEGRGLFVVLSGELEVFARDPSAQTEVHLARLSTSDIFGEMSLMTNQPTSASVRSRTRCTLLYLARAYVDRLSAAFPEVRATFAAMTERRARNNQLKLGARLPDEPLELDIDDVLLL